MAYVHVSRETGLVCTLCNIKHIGCWITCSVLAQAVLETIRDLMNTNCLVPDWIHDTFLGYGDPASANYTRLPNQVTDLNFNDTFLSLQHLKDSFPDCSIEVGRWCVRV